MEQDDRDSPDWEWNARIEAAYGRMLQGLPPVPWLPRVMNLTDLRRTVARLRAGVIRPNHPWMSAEAYADTLEQGIVMNLLEMRKQIKEIEEEERRRARRAEDDAAVVKCYWEIFHHMKKMPEAADPNDPIAGQVRLMYREWRAGQGRSRKRRKKRSAEGGE